MKNFDAQPAMNYEKYLALVMVSASFIINLEITGTFINIIFTQINTDKAEIW